MATREITGKQVEFDDEGFMANPDEWTKETKELSEKAQGNLDKAKEFILHSLLG